MNGEDAVLFLFYFPHCNNFDLFILILILFLFVSVSNSN
jgi:hypothetical protein